MTIRRGKESIEQRAQRAMRDVFPGSLGGITPVADPFAPAVVPGGAAPGNSLQLFLGGSSALAGAPDRFFASFPQTETSWLPTNGFESDLPWSASTFTLSEGDAISVGAGGTSEANIILLSRPGIYAFSVDIQVIIGAGSVRSALLKTYGPDQGPFQQDTVYGASVDALYQPQMSVCAVWRYSPADIAAGNGFFVTQFGWDSTPTEGGDIAGVNGYLAVVRISD